MSVLVLVNRYLINPSCSGNARLPGASLLIRPRSWKYFLFAPCLLVFAMGIPAYGQAASFEKKLVSLNVSDFGEGTRPGGTVQLLPGVVVEKIEKESDTDAAGLKEGDILLSWSRGKCRGEIHTPWDHF